MKDKRTEGDGLQAMWRPWVGRGKFMCLEKTRWFGVRLSLGGKGEKEWDEELRGAMVRM